MRRFLIFLLILLLLLGGYSAWALGRPLPQLQPHNVATTLPAAQTPALMWPDYGGAAVGAVGYGLLASHGSQKAVPTASVAKVMIALAVLQKKPLKPGEQGPVLTIGDQDITFYNKYVAGHGSVVPVNYGEQLSEYQALQALLLPSGNNIAESLAYWAFGSMDSYLSYANGNAKKLGMQHTHFADASGYHPQTVSTPDDLVRLGEAALKNPVLARIVSQSSADIPVAGTVQNVNDQLGVQGINGIKTGNTDEAGGVYLASATYTISGHSVTVVTAVTGAPDLDSAMTDTLPLLASARNGFGDTAPVHAGDVAAYYNTPWHTSANVVVNKTLAAFGWKGAAIHPAVRLQPLNPPASYGQTVGSLTIPGAGTTNLSLQQPLAPPSWQWRWLHP
jgi:D-alanyl-D-alanine carboxypeptidase (penicillin-binding protein 5/6)